MTLLSPRKSTFSVSHAILSTEDDPAVWVIQNKSLLSIRSAKGAIAAYVAEGCDAATKRQRSQRYSELHEVMSFFLQRSGDRTEGERTSTPRPQENDSALLHSILLDSGIRGAPSRDVIAHFSVCTGFVNGTLSRTMKKALSEIQARPDSFIQSDSTHVRMISSREVPNRVLKYARDTRLSIFETDLLLHFLDHPNKPVSLAEVQVLSAKDSSSLNDLDDALQELEAFRRKIASGPFVIDRQVGGLFKEPEWRLCMDPEIHQKLATNTIGSAELRDWQVETTPLEILKVPSLGELTNIQSKENVSTVYPEHEDELQSDAEASDKEPSAGSRASVQSNSTGANASTTSTTGGAVTESASPAPAIPDEEETMPEHVPGAEQTTKSPSAQRLSGSISEYIRQRAEELGRLCKTEFPTEIVCSSFELLARQKAQEVAPDDRKQVVDTFEVECKDKWKHLFTVEKPSQIFSDSQFQDYIPVSYPAGSEEKIEVFIRRYESGWPLFHPEDRDVANGEADDYVDFDGPSDEQLDSLSKYEYDL